MGLLRASGAIQAYAAAEAKKRAIWEKATPIMGKDRDVWRRDIDQRVICYDNHGDRSSPFGWEFDHFPVAASLGGPDVIANLRPLHWRGNVERGNALRSLFDDLDFDPSSRR